MNRNVVVLSFEWKSQWESNTRIWQLHRHFIMNHINKYKKQSFYWIKENRRALVDASDISRMIQLDNKRTIGWGKTFAARLKQHKKCSRCNFKRKRENKKTITKHTGIKKSVSMSLDWNVNVCSHHSTPAGFYSKWTEILLSRVYGKIWVVNARHNVSIFNKILDLFLHFSPPKVYLSENPITFMKHPPD